MDQKPLWKTVWNCHILDKLYYQAQGHVLDTPIFTIEIEERVVSINGFKFINDTTFKDRYFNHFYYLNRVDAELELQKLNEKDNSN